MSLCPQMVFSFTSKATVHHRIRICIKESNLHAAVWPRAAEGRVFLCLAACRYAGRLLKYLIQTYDLTP